MILSSLHLCTHSWFNTNFLELECGFNHGSNVRIVNFIPFWIPFLTKRILKFACVSYFIVRKGKFAVYATSFCVETKCVDAKLVVKMNRP